MISHKLVTADKPNSIQESNPAQALQKRLIEETKRRGHVIPPAEDQIISTEQLTKNQPELEWFNGAQKNFAKRRLIEAQVLRVPYVAASQELDSKTLLFDGMMALDALDREAYSSKNFNSSGKEWIHSPSLMKFQAYIFEEEKWVILGSFSDLENMGLSSFTISRLLSASACLANHTSDDPDYDEPRRADREAIRAKIAYWALLQLPTLKDKYILDEKNLLVGVETNELDYRLLESVAISSTHDLLVLNSAVANKFNVNRRCEEFSCFPVTWAALKGSREAVEKLLPLSQAASQELNFVEQYRGRVKEEAQVMWYVSLFSKP